MKLTAGGMANPGVANNGIHSWPISGGFNSSQQVVCPLCPIQEWPIMGPMYGFVRETWKPSAHIRKVLIKMFRPSNKMIQLVTLFPKVFISYCLEGTSFSLLGYLVSYSVSHQSFLFCLLCLPFCLSSFLFVFLFYLLFCLSSFMFIFLSVCLPFCLSSHLFVFLSVYLAFCFSYLLYVISSVCLPFSFCLLPFYLSSILFVFSVCRSSFFHILPFCLSSFSFLLFAY